MNGKNSVKNAIKKASEKKVEFFYPEVAAFKEAVLPLHNKLLKEKPKLQTIYNQIQEKNKIAVIENEKIKYSLNNFRNSYWYFFYNHGFTCILSSNYKIYIT